MKKLNCSYMASAAVAIGISFSSLAQDSLKDDRLADQNVAKSWHQMPKLDRFEKAGKVLGAEIKNDQNQRLGKVKDLAVDLENGRIVEVIVAAGGHLGVGEEIVAVPPGLFRLDETNKILRLDSTVDRLKAAPRFDLSSWDASVDNPNVVAVYQHYGAAVYFGIDTQGTRQASRAPLGYITRASKLIGAPARNLHEEKLGKVENLVLDLPAGRIPEVIIGTGGFLGLREAYSVLPPSALHFDADHKGVRLDISKETLLSAPYYLTSEFTGVNDPSYAVGVYHFYHVAPYFSTNEVDNTARNIRDRSNTTLTPLDQGNSPEDRSITAQIRKQILATEQLSVNARNIKIITVHGKVTLRGPVDSDHEKELLGDIAAHCSSASRVVNQLDVKKTPEKPDSSN